MVDENTDDGVENDGDDILRTGEVASYKFKEATHACYIFAAGVVAACCAKLKELSYWEHPACLWKLEERGEGEFLFVHSDFERHC